MKRTPLFAFVVLVAGLLATSFGCELIAGVDRNKIEATGTGGSTSSTGGGGTGGTGGTTTSSGGTGGTTSSSSTGGMPCMTIADCPAVPNDCVENTCDGGVCGTANKADGTVLDKQKAGDCKVDKCKAGAVESAVDETDVPDDSNDCTDDSCTNDVPSNTPKAANSPCGATGMLHCDGAGKCVDCLAPADCGMDTECQTRTCDMGVCGLMNAMQGKPLAMQSAGDCKVDQCDGNGFVETVDDNADVPVDGTVCTNDVCLAGVPSNPPVAAQTACMEGSGTLCDGNGKCDECLQASDCPGADDECKTRTCTMGVCGVTFTAAGTAVMSQTGKDCKQNVCDGAGVVIVANDDTDLPDDNNACTTDTCVMGVKTFTNKSQGTTCGAGQVCDNGGQCVGCNAPTDCAGQDDDCKVRTCSAAHVCGFNFQPNGTPVPMQTSGDCKQNVCDGSGNTVSQNDNADVPADDGNQCTSDVCNAGLPSHPAKATNTACSQNGGSFCSAAGACVQCNAPAQCPGSDTECQARSCNANSCGFTFQPNGTVTPTQVSGDCKVRQCDGAGNFVQANSNGDVPADDGQQCTDEVCNAGVPAHPAKAVNTACTQNGGSFCNATGLCVQCNAAAQCPGSDTDCHVKTCSAAGACGVNNIAAGTPTSMQSTGDCKENQCDGSGNIVSANKDIDLPADDGNQCTQEICTAGVPSHPARAVNTTCNQNGGSFCNAAGSCVQCNAAAQCPGADTACHTRTCSAAGACGAMDVAAGTPTGSQTANDCKENQCDGNGNIVSANKDTDVPVDDGNQCTDEICTAGVPSHPAKAVNTTCNQNGGSFCNAAAACVACNTAAQCPGSDTDCHTRTCNAAGACGVNNVASGTPTSMQSTGDCQENQCDGNGNIVSANKDTDVPADDGSQCTDEVCTAGVPSHPAKAVNTACSQNGGSFCNAIGACVACNAAAQCPGSDTDCHTRTCNAAGACGVNNVAAGTPTSSQSTGDCKENQCDGSGNIVSANKDTDLPADDGLQCTDEVCTAGVASHPAKAINTSCSQGGGSFCNATGSCVACNTAAQCPGSDTDCQSRTCSAAGACGVNNVAAGTPTPPATQIAGNCQQLQCDGNGGTMNAADDADVPADDGNQCTLDICAGGVPSHPTLALNTPCNQNGGSFCSASATCVQCNVATQCPGSDTECHTRTCSGAGTCGSNDALAGTVTSGQIAGDCKQNQCDGAGNIASVNFDTDVPVDGNQCTNDVCTGGVASNPAFPLGTSCNQAGGTVCNGTGSCVVQPQVTGTTPSDGAGNVAVTTTIQVAFSTAMTPGTLTAQTTSGACSGNIQVSSNDFTTCIGFTSSTATPSGGNTIGTLTPLVRLFAGTTYRIRVTTGVTSSVGIPMAATFTTPTGFATLAGANACDGNLVISQVYGGGGNTGAQYKNDFVELHNRGTTPVSLNGLSLQYTSATGNAWASNKVNLNNVSVLPGAYYLVQLNGAAAANGAALPAADQLWALDISGTNGKMSLVNGTAGMSANICPDANLVLDFVGYGATANCFEGTVAAPTLSNTTAAQRGEVGCADTNANNSNFTAVAPVPHNSASAVSNCSCNAVANETDKAAEADYCVLQFPSAFTVPPATTVYGRIFEAGSTNTANNAVSPNVIAQFGYGPNGSNPTTSNAWYWYSATYNAGFVDASNEEFQSTVNSAVPGTYSYTYRYSFDGLQWTYCDTDGAGSNSGLTFSAGSLGTMTAN